MLKKKNKKEEKNLDDKTVKIGIIILFFLFMIGFIFLTGSRKSKKETVIEVDKEKIINLFSKINDNYTLVINKNINNDINKIIYYKSKDGEMYEVGNSLYFIYNKIKYKINVDNGKIQKVNDKLDFTNDRFSDIDLLKKVFNYCEFEYINDVKVNCKIKYSDYLNEYNKMYNTSLVTDHNNFIDFNIVYYEDSIGKINVDYTNINEIVNFNNDDIVYGIKIENIDSNDFSILFEKYKDVIKK